MLIFFSFLILIVLSLFGTAFYFVFVAHDLLMHFYFGLIAVVSVLITHCWVFFYFIGTGEGIREGILEHRLDQAPIKVTKKFKGMTFPFALFSMIFAITAAVLGGAARFHKVSTGWHYGFVYFAMAFNLFAFWQEFRVIRRNEKLMNQLNASIRSLGQSLLA